MPGPGRAEGSNTTRAPRRIIDTDLPNVRLIGLSPDDAEAFYDLIDRNRTHLTQHGDWTDLGDATPESVHASLSNLDERHAQFGIWLDGRLIGRTDLNARTPGNFVLSYWLGREFTGKGYATAACKALMAFGKAELSATNVYTGVTKGNVMSEALLARLGFQAIEDRGTYTRFRLSLPQSG